MSVERHGMASEGACVLIETIFVEHLAGRYASQRLAYRIKMIIKKQLHQLDGRGDTAQVGGRLVLFVIRQKNQEITKFALLEKSHETAIQCLSRSR
jgi:hypothetical protein